MRKHYDGLFRAVKRLFGSEDDGRQFFALVEEGGEPPQIQQEEEVKRRKSSRSKDDLVISSFDKERLMRLLRTAHGSADDREEREDLAREMERGREVRPQEIPPDVVTMNSSVRVTDVESGASDVCTIVFPPDADYEKGKISILAPLGTALLGYRVGDVVDWHTPRGVRRLRIDEIIYQPETAGGRLLF
jgi:regulator of nucleoside diphosphate kinase